MARESSWVDIASGIFLLEEIVAEGRSTGSANAKVGTTFTDTPGLATSKTGTDDDDTLNGLDKDDQLVGGAGNDKLDGGDDNDTLQGGTGSDTLIGGAGNDQFNNGDFADGAVDSMTGGAGNDVYFVFETQDKVLESDPAGGTEDRIVSNITFSLAALANVENLDLVGVSFFQALNGTGNAGVNRLGGNGGDNILDGGKGIDVFVGGGGDDTFILDDPGEDNSGNVIEGADAGTDTVKTARTDINLAIDNVENYTFTGTGGWLFDGNSLDNVITGGAGGDLLDGKGGNDTLIGGTGIDAMTGGLGNDTFFVENAKDTVFEGGAGGTDRIVSTLSIDLTDATFGAQEIENVTLIGTAAKATGTGGKNNLIGNDSANVLDGGGNEDRMAGGKGNDSYTIDDAGDRVFEFAGEGTDTVTTSIDLDFSGILANRAIENFILTGAANDVRGNELANVITGNTGLFNTLFGNEGSDKLAGGGSSDKLFGGDGNDVLSSGGNTLSDGLSTLDGGAGNDMLIGGTGNDQYVVDSLGDKIVETTKSAGAGLDTEDEVIVTGLFDFSLAALTNIERLTIANSGALNGTGNALDNLITAFNGDNVLDGGAGNDTLNSGADNDTLIGGAGLDSFNGGDGNDTYVLDSLAEFGKITENFGSDTIKTAVLFSETDFVTGIENYVYTGSAQFKFDATGLTSVQSLTGGSASDQLTASTSDTRLDGGVGADTLIGNIGADTFVVDNLGDEISDLGGVNTLVINRSVNLTSPISPFDSSFGGIIRNVTLTGTAALNVTGDNQANILTGNAGANKLDGVDGADTLIGGKGNDTYFVYGKGETVVENDNEGTDTVVTTATISLQFDAGYAGQKIENVTAAAGAGNIDVAGNELVNIVTGNEGDNQLNGLGGNDTMIGGKGNDIYFVDSIGDKVVETLSQAAGGGTADRVFSQFTFSIAALANIEELTLTGTTTATVDDTDDINGTGNAAANIIDGNKGNNILDGAGGNDTLLASDGDDTLIGGTGTDSFNGGKGDDTYVVDSLAEFANITDSANSFLGDTLRTSAFFITTDVQNAGLFSVIENFAFTGSAKWAFDIAALTGNHALTGGSGSDTLATGKGDDTLNGGAGADTLSGGLGADTYVIDNIGDKITDTGGSADSILINRSIDISSSNKVAADQQFVNVIEHITLTGTAALNVKGDGNINILVGNDGANIIDGGTGDDTLIGGKGNDTYIFYNQGEDIIELDGGGIDTVKTAAGVSVVSLSTFSGGAFIENMAILTPGLSAVDFTGNDLDNVLTAADGDDILQGGKGNDTLNGGKGSDTYVVDSIGDKIVETFSGAVGGTGDNVFSSVSYSLAPFANVEQLSLSGSDNIDATGNGLANELSGNTGNNVLNGGAGIDSMFGGDGDDTYIVDNIAEFALVSEIANQGSDTIRTALLFSEANAVTEVENYTYTGSAVFKFDASALNGADHALTGGSAADTLIGADGADRLDGGKGNDIMRGGSGDDTYVVDSLGDVVDEASNGDANDAVIINRSVNLLTDFAGDIESVTLTGTAALNAVGNFSGNALRGNDGNNVLAGGNGTDTLTGGKGDDTLSGGNDLDTDIFRYQALTDRGTGKELIQDFVVGAGGDVINVAELMSAIGYGGADPFADEILNMVDDGKGNSILMIDADGTANGANFITLVTVQNAELTNGDTANFVF